MEDSIVQQLRDRAYAFKATDRLSEQAADEIERLQRRHPPQSAGETGMTDITDRLRTWCHAPNAASAQDLMDEAAEMIGRLRSSMAEQQFCKLPVAGSSPAVGSLDAVPDAIAYADGEPAPTCGGGAGLSPRDGTGNTPQTHTTPGEGSAPGVCTLTDEEREAIERAEARLRTAYVPDDETAATLLKLLERTK